VGGARRRAPEIAPSLTGDALDADYRLVNRAGSVLLAALALLVAGCGSAEPGSEDAPKPADLAADAFAALAKAGSAHYVVDLRVDFGPSDGATAPLVLHAEGDASATAVTAEGKLDFGSGPMEGKLVIGPHDLFLEADGKWYGESGPGLAMAFAALAGQQEVSADLSSPEGIRESFDDFFTGEVVAGPEIDGVATWQFQGQANPDGLAEFENPQDLLEGDLERLETLAAALQLTLVVGQQDQLPRRIELHFRLSEEERAELGEFYAGDFQGWSRNDIDAKLILSRFGEPVSYDPPENYGSLDAFLDNLFPFE
jgi:hypothetical protein